MRIIPDSVIACAIGHLILLKLYGFNNSALITLGGLLFQCGEAWHDRQSQCREIQRGRDSDNANKGKIDFRYDPHGSVLLPQRYQIGLNGRFPDRVKTLFGAIPHPPTFFKPGMLDDHRGIATHDVKIEIKGRWHRRFPACVGHWALSFASAGAPDLPWGQD
jgi:hypothetical protein